MSDKEFNILLNTATLTAIISFLIGIFLGNYINNSQWRDSCIQNNVGYYDNSTGAFKLKDLNVNTNK